MLPRGHVLEVIKVAISGVPKVNQRVPGYPGTRLNRVPEYPGAQVPVPPILGEYQVLLVSVTGISKPGNTRECPDNWQKKAKG